MKILLLISMLIPLGFFQEVEEVGGPVSATLTKDAEVQEADPTSNFGTLSRTSFRGDASNHRDVYFVFSGCPASHTTATLRITQRFLSGDTTMTITRFSAAGDLFTEASITWNTVPTVGTNLGNASITFLTADDETERDFDMTGLSPDGSGFVTIKLQATSGSGTVVGHHALDNGSLYAQLIFDE